MGLIAYLVNIPLTLIKEGGYPLIFILIAMESSYIPIPSEIILPFSGYLVYMGIFNFWLVFLVSVAGTVAGATAGYVIAYQFGEDRTATILKYFLITKKDLNKAKIFFNKYGSATIFISRMLPAVRTYIAFPAGIYDMDIKKYFIYTATGTVPWCLFLIYVGIIFGPHWNYIDSSPVHYLLYLFAIIFVLFILYKVTVNQRG